MDGIKVNLPLEDACSGGSGSIDWQDVKDTYTPPLQPLYDFLANVVITRGPRGSARIFLRKDAFRELVRNASADTSREHGGILLGEPFRDSDETHYVVVHRAIPATNTEGSAVHLQFRPESWHHIWNELEKRPNLNIIGWYHTHPGLGIFLSGTDKKTQHLYFSQPWQIAAVVDPIRKKLGFFMGKEGNRCPAVIFHDGKGESPQHDRGADQ